MESEATTGLNDHNGAPKDHNNGPQVTTTGPQLTTTAEKNGI